jgi:hypothetical protein
MAVPAAIPREQADLLLTTVLIFASVLHTKCKNAVFVGARQGSLNATERRLDDDE